jgi:hypothetical protein
MAKTTADKFAEAIQKELDKYGEDMQKTVAQLRTSVGKAGLRTLRSASRSTFGGTGKYASGWTMTEEGDRVYAKAVLHNTHPGLPHLLEYGHANRGGGRTAGRTHIKPVEEEMIREFEKGIEDAI